MSKISKIDEKKLAGASYIFSFYKEVQILTDYYSQYINFLLEIKEKSKGIDIDKLGDAEKTTIMQGVQQVRISAHKSYVQYISIIGVLKIKDDDKDEDKIKESYKKVKTDYIINEGDLETYVISLNKFLLNGIIQSLLEDSQHIIEEVYKDAGEESGGEEK